MVSLALTPSCAFISASSFCWTASTSARADLSAEPKACSAAFAFARCASEVMRSCVLLHFSWASLSSCSAFVARIWAISRDFCSSRIRSEPTEMRSLDIFWSNSASLCASGIGLGSTSGPITGSNISFPRRSPPCKCINAAKAKYPRAPPRHSMIELACLLKKSTPSTHSRCLRIW